MTSRVLAVVEPLIAAFGAESDPTCWVVWGDDPTIRYVIFIPVAAGVVQVHVRVNVPQEGPRASAKLTRWDRLQVGELAMEVAGGHRLLSFQVEGQILKGADDDADAIAGFALDLFAAIDGRVVEAPSGKASTGKRSRASKGSAGAEAPRADRPSEALRLPPPPGG